MRLFGSKDIKVYVKKYFVDAADKFVGKKVIDLPAGSGASTELLKGMGVDVEPYDLFPELFKLKGVECKQADMQATLPIDDAYADVVLFQEGIEHINDQLKALREMNRIIKPGGLLLLTTPNYSNLRAKLSYFLNESEIYKLMPPNSIESIWFSDNSADDGRYYFGHVFLIGIHRLRLLASLSGFEIKSIQHTRINITSLLLLLTFYPLILFSSYRAYKRAIRKNAFVELGARKKIFKQVFLLMINPKILIDSHLFVEFEKERELREVSDKDIYNKHSDTSFDT